TIGDQPKGYGVLLVNGATQNIIGGSGAAGNSYRNNGKGNVVFGNGDSTGGNTFGDSNSNAGANASVQPAAVQGHKQKRTPRVKHAVAHHHPKGPRPLFKKHGRHRHG